MFFFLFLCASLLPAIVVPLIDSEQEKILAALLVSPSIALFAGRPPLLSIHASGKLFTPRPKNTNNWKFNRKTIQSVKLDAAKPQQYFRKSVGEFERSVLSSGSTLIKTLVERCERSKRLQ